MESDMIEWIREKNIKLIDRSECWRELGMVNWKKILLEAVFGFILWTLFLTPYMIFVVGTSLEQYILWMGMQLCLVPPLAPLVFKITKYVEKRVFRKNHV